jgi:hypothetical protein
VLKIFAIPGNAQAKIEDVSRVLLNHVSQMPGKSIIQQVTTGTGQPFADIGKKLAVGYFLIHHRDTPLVVLLIAKS